jgi:uncharacterized protein YndB with AHSA1/START domain
MPDLKAKIAVEVIVNAPAEKVWRFFTEPVHIVNWNNPSPDWHTPKAVNDLQVGGMFNYRMEAKDGSAGFDFGGTYDEVAPHERISYTIGDGRKVLVMFKEQDSQTRVAEEFEAETVNSMEKQRDGWQAILENFKKYVEEN